MTVIDANNLIFDWFSHNDSLVLERDLKQVVAIFEDEKETKIIMKMALSDLCEAKLIRVCEDEKYYILNKPFASYQQNPEISNFVAGYVSKEINDFCELIQDDTDMCDSGNITEKDIKNLCHIIDYYKEAVNKK